MLVGDLVIDGRTFQKTSGVVVVPVGDVGSISRTGDEWSTYYSGSDPSVKGFFFKKYSVELSPFAMSAYEVTQELYTAVMGKNPSYFVGGRVPATGENQNLRPVESVSWYDAIVFCNELTKKTFGENQCIYSNDRHEIYSKKDVGWETPPQIISSNRIGYRLPREVEWEVAARGGGSN